MGFKQWLFENLRFRPTIFLFRGIGGEPNPMERLGRWWSTNPYYSLRFGSHQVGNVFVAQISQADLNQGLQNSTITDASQDEYPNYIFRNEDPPQARPMTQQEIRQFGILSGQLDQNGQQHNVQSRFPGANNLYKSLWGQDAIDAAYKVFGG